MASKPHSELLTRAAREPLGVDISDYSDEFCAGFLAGQVNALEESGLLEQYEGLRASIRFCPNCAHGYEWQRDDPPEGLCPGCRRAFRIEEQLEAMERNVEMYRAWWANVSEQLEAAQNRLRAIATVEWTSLTAIQVLGDVQALAANDSFPASPPLCRCDGESCAIEFAPPDEADLVRSLYRCRRESSPASNHPTLDDRNPASVVGVPWNEKGYAGEASNQERLPDASNREGSE